jgi:hypothetical protein
VSRNSWLNSGTLTSDAPVTISQTWADSGQTFKALVVNAAGSSGTNSASGSLLADFQVNGATQFSVRKDGRTKVGNIIDIGASLLSWESPYLRTYSSFSCARLDIGAVGTVLLEWDAANTLALRNGAAAQTFNVYGTWTTAITNFERLAIKYNTTDVAYQIAAEKGTTNGDYRPLQLWTGGASRLHITTAGNVGIGTTAPTSKLQVSAGDVEVDTIAKGVILKSPDGTRYRVTVANGGTLSVAAV